MLDKYINSLSERNKEYFDDMSKEDKEYLELVVKEYYGKYETFKLDTLISIHQNMHMGIKNVKWATQDFVEYWQPLWEKEGKTPTSNDWLDFEVATTTD